MVTILFFISPSHRRFASDEETSESETSSKLSLKANSHSDLPDAQGILTAFTIESCIHCVLEKSIPSCNTGINLWTRRAKVP